MFFCCGVYVCVYLDVRTTWYHNIGQTHGGFNVLLKRWLDKLVVLFDDTVNVSSPLCNVPPQPANQADVRVCVHKNLHVQQLTGTRTNRHNVHMNTKLKDNKMKTK